MKTSKRVRDWRFTYEVSIGLSLWPSKDGIGIRHLRVWRRDGKDGISWDVLQCIKNDTLGPEVLAVEVFPPHEQLVDSVNMRHLWEVPSDLADRFPSLPH